MKTSHGDFEYRVMICDEVDRKVFGVCQNGIELDRMVRAALEQNITIYRITVDLVTGAGSGL